MYKISIFFILLSLSSFSDELIWEKEIDYDYYYVTDTEKYLIHNTKNKPNSFSVLNINTGEEIASFNSDTIPSHIDFDNQYFLVLRDSVFYKYDFDGDLIYKEDFAEHTNEINFHDIQIFDLKGTHKYVIQVSFMNPKDSYPEGNAKYEYYVFNPKEEMIDSIYAIQSNWSPAYNYEINSYTTNFVKYVESVDRLLISLNHHQSYKEVREETLVSTGKNLIFDGVKLVDELPGSLYYLNFNGKNYIGAYNYRYNYQYINYPLTEFINKDYDRQISSFSKFNIDSITSHYIAKYHLNSDNTSLFSDCDKFYRLRNKIHQKVYTDTNSVSVYSYLSHEDNRIQTKRFENSTDYFSFNSGSNFLLIGTNSFSYFKDNITDGKLVRFKFDSNLFVNSNSKVVNLTKNADSFIWKIGGQIFSNEREPVFNFDSPGQYTITLEANFNGEVKSFLKTFTVYDSLLKIELEKIQDEFNTYIKVKSNHLSGYYWNFGYVSSSSTSGTFTESLKIPITRSVFKVDLNVKSYISGIPEVDTTFVVINKNQNLTPSNINEIEISSYNFINHHLGEYLFKSNNKLKIVDLNQNVDDFELENIYTEIRLVNGKVQMIQKPEMGKTVFYFYDKYGNEEAYEFYTHFNEISVNGIFINDKFFFISDNYWVSVFDKNADLIESVGYADTLMLGNSNAIFKTYGLDGVLVQQVNGIYQHLFSSDNYDILNSGYTSKPEILNYLSKNNYSLFLNKYQKWDSEWLFDYKGKRNGYNNVLNIMKGDSINIEQDTPFYKLDEHEYDNIFEFDISGDTVETYLTYFDSTTTKERLFQRVETIDNKLISHNELEYNGKVVDVKKLSNGELIVVSILDNDLYFQNYYLEETINLSIQENQNSNIQYLRCIDLLGNEYHIIKNNKPNFELLENGLYIIQYIENNKLKTQKIYVK